MPVTANFSRLICGLAVVLLGLSPNYALAQDVSTAKRAIEQAEKSYQRGKPDYLLLKRALDAADASGDLRLRARANLLQARVDSSENRRSRSIPYFNKANQLLAEAERQEQAEVVTTAQSDARAAIAEKEAALADKAVIVDQLERERGSASTKYWSIMAAWAIALAVLILIFAFTVRKLRGDIVKARKAKDESDEGFAKARTQMTSIAKASMQRIRRLVQTYAKRIPPAQPGSASNQLAAHDLSLQYMMQSSFDSGDSYEVAMESFFAKFNPELVRLSSSRQAEIETDSMPIRLPLDQALPFVLAYSELGAFAIHKGSTRLKVSFTKEGQQATLKLIDLSGELQNADVEAEELRFARVLIEELGGQLQVNSTGETTISLKFITIPGKIGGNV